jgi:hypothetical protein
MDAAVHQLARGGFWIGKGAGDDEFIHAIKFKVESNVWALVAGEASILRIRKVHVSRRTYI